MSNANIRCALAAIWLTGMVGCANDEPVRSTAQCSTAVESKPPPIGLLDLDGNPFYLWQQEKGAVIVFLFTRTDCPISNRFAPEICRLHAIYHRRGVEFYLVYVDPSEQPVAIRRHLDEYGYPCRGIRDPQHTLVACCGATTTPEAVVFDKDRAIAYRGRINDLYVDIGKPRAVATTHDLEDAIESTVLGRPVAVPRTKAVGCLIADLND
jgi:hypothetical protein